MVLLEEDLGVSQYTRPVDLPRSIPPPGDWYHDGACKGQETARLFYPEVATEADEGLKFCVACPVVGDCRTYAHANNLRFGTWGGETEWDRRRPNRRRAAAASSERLVRTPRVTYAGPVEAAIEDTCPFCGEDFIVPGAGTSMLCLECKATWPRAVM